MLLSQFTCAISVSTFTDIAYNSITYTSYLPQLAFLWLYSALLRVTNPTIFSSVCCISNYDVYYSERIDLIEIITLTITAGSSCCHILLPCTYRPGIISAAAMRDCYWQRAQLIRAFILLDSVMLPTIYAPYYTYIRSVAKSEILHNTFDHSCLSTMAHTQLLMFAAVFVLRELPRAYTPKCANSRMCSFCEETDDVLHHAVISRSWILACIGSFSAHCDKR